MWRLLLSEWEYNRIILVTTGVFYLSLGAAYSIWGGREPGAEMRAFRVLVIFCVSVVWLFQILRKQKERIDRLHSLLPVSRLNVALFRLFFLTGFWVVLMSIFTASRLVSATDVSRGLLGRDVVSFSGIFLLANGITLISRDHRYSALNRFWMTAVRILVALFFISGYLLFILHGALRNELGFILNDLNHVFRAAYYSVPGSLCILSAGLLCSWLSVVVYIRRIDYRE